MCLTTTEGRVLADSVSKKMILQAIRQLHRNKVIGTESLNVIYMFICKCVNKYNPDYFSRYERELFESHFDLLFYIFKNINFYKTIQNIDIIGYIYEISTQYGTTYNHSKDYGQFFTNKDICEEMIELCAPKENESVCDTSMGTGGMLISYIQYMLKNKLKSGDIHGFDIDPYIIQLSKINLNMYIPEKNFNVSCQDSLLKGLSTKYDIIITNVPFGIQKYSYDTTCERIQDNNINCTRSEPLFIQLIVNSLKDNGRSAVIVPETFLISPMNQCKNTRKFLLSKTSVSKIIKLSGKFFTNTKCQPYIIFFHKGVGGGDAIEFLEIRTDEENNNNNLYKESIGSLLCTGVNTSTYSLHPMSYFSQQQQQQIDCSTESTTLSLMCPLQKVCYVFKGRRLKEEGTLFPYLDTSCQCKKYVDECICVDPVVLTPSVYNIGKFFWVNQPCHPSDNMIIIQPINENILMAKYLFYYCEFYIKDILQKYIYGTKPMINLSMFEKIKINMPSSEIQNRVVSTIDNLLTETTIEKMENFSHNWISTIINDKGHDFTDMRSVFVLYEHTLLLKQYMKNYIDNLMSIRLKVVHTLLVPLSDIILLNPETAKETEYINYIDLSSVKNGVILDRQRLQWDARPKRASRKVRPNDIIWGTVRPLSKSFAFITPDDIDNTIVSSAFVVIRCVNTQPILPYYLYHCLITPEFITYLDTCCAGMYHTYSPNVILDYKIQIPSISWQKHFIENITNLKNSDHYFSNILSVVKDNNNTTPKKIL
jgi:hypothetical protein